MSNPYATPIKLAKRALDDLRVAIAGQAKSLARLDGRDAVLVTVRGFERSRAAGDLQLPATAWFERTERERAGIAVARRGVERQCAELREQAREQLGSLSALEAAAERWARAERSKRERRAEAEADDRAAVQFLRAQAA